MKNNTSNRTLKLLIIAILICTVQTLVGQNDGRTELIVKNVDNTIFELGQNSDRRYLNGNVEIIQDSSYFFCDKALLENNILYASGNVTIVQNDSIRIFADSLYYNGDSLQAELINKVIMLVGLKKLKTSHLTYDLKEKIGRYANGAQLTQDSTELISKRGTYFVNESLVEFRDYVRIRDTAFLLHADSLNFETDIRKAHFLGPTRITQNSSLIYCEGGFYDIPNHLASFEQNAKYQDDDVLASAENIVSINDGELIKLVGNAMFEDSTMTATADSILHQATPEMTTFNGNVTIEGERNNAIGDFIQYDHVEDSFLSKGRATITEESWVITADDIHHVNEGESFAKGKVILLDTLAQTKIHCDHFNRLEEEKGFIAVNNDTIRPWMEILMENDTMFLSADTLMSQDSIQQLDTIRLFKAFHDVRILHPNYQSLCDSLVYFTEDSIFLLLGDPILWSDSTQFSGDSVSITMKDDKIDEIYIRNNALIISDQKFGFFNQVKSKLVNVYFENDSLKLMKTFGNAITHYYMKDEFHKFVGAIHTQCSKMDFHFKNNELNQIKYYSEPISDLKPIKSELGNPKRLDGFKWHEAYRPGSLADLTSPPKRKLIVDLERKVESSIERSLDDASKPVDSKKSIDQ